MDYRAANIRACYVYVISNVGALGQVMIKVGLTRRLDLEPMDRIRELGDASLPFKFDVHALAFSQDAVGIETQMHHRLADRCVNLVNLHREFFYAKAAESRDLFADFAFELLQLEESPEAIEFHQTQHRRPPGASPCHRNCRDMAMRPQTMPPDRRPVCGGVDDLGLPSRPLVAGGGPSGCLRLARWRGRRPLAWRATRVRFPRRPLRGGQRG